MLSVSEFGSSKRLLEAEILSLAAWVGHRRVQASKSSSSVDFHMMLLNDFFLADYQGSRGEQFECIICDYWLISQCAGFESKYLG